MKSAINQDFSLTKRQKTNDNFRLQYKWKSTIPMLPMYCHAHVLRGYNTKQWYKFIENVELQINK